MKVVYRYCGNPKCKVYEKECEVDNLFCGKCGEMTLYKYHGDPPKPDPEPPVISTLWVIFFLIIFILMIFAINMPPLN
jgi:hypothetical protein